MLGFIKQVFIKLLIASTKISVGKSLTSNFKGHMKCVSLNNQPCQARPTLVNINSNKTPFLSLYCQY